MGNDSTTSDLIRLVGVMAICVGLAWALQILGLSPEGTALGRLMWVMGAASIAGAGVGAVYVATALRARESSVRA